MNLMVPCIVDNRHAIDVDKAWRKTPNRIGTREGKWLKKSYVK